MIRKNQNNCRPNHRERRNIKYEKCDTNQKEDGQGFAKSEDSGGITCRRLYIIKVRNFTKSENFTK